MSHKDSNPIPASLRIGNHGSSSPARGKRDLLKDIDRDYADWLGNQTEWINDPNAIRDLIINMKIVIDDLRRMQDLQHDLPAEARDWDIR